MDFDETWVSYCKFDDEGQDQANSNNSDDSLFLEHNLSVQQLYPTKGPMMFLVYCTLPLMHALIEEERTAPLTSVLRVGRKFFKK